MKIRPYRHPLGSYEIGRHVLEPGRHVTAPIRIVFDKTWTVTSDTKTIKEKPRYTSNIRKDKTKEVVHLIKKERHVPWKIRKWEALLRRLPSAHPERTKLEEQLAMSRAGYRGETSMDYHLNFLPSHDCYVLHDLRLQGERDTYFQIDTLLITPHFLLILEIKNIAGTLYFDPSFQQMIRTLDDKEEAFPDPLLQLSRQKSQLQNWLIRHKLPQAPVPGFVVISNASAVLKADPENRDMYHSVIRPPSLPYSFESLQKKYAAVTLTKQQVQKISRKLKKFHQHHIPDTPSEVEPRLLRTGVYCPDCHHLPLPRQRGGWYCGVCHSLHPQAHTASLIDYALIHKTTITNRECRTFLQLDSPSVVAKLFHQLDLPYTGSYKNRRYTLPLEILARM
ncbi:nuclease-related domain-containing protein [Salibacterium halotolerans]|nr:nuclease-related domain-containing protein [Salibacterium halotolerans]